MATSKAKCDSCHNTLVKGDLEDGENHYGGYFVGNPDVCKLCHSPTENGDMFEQSRELASYVHAIHEGQPFAFANPDSSVHYPMSLSNCESCHEKDTYDFPTKLSDLSVKQSGSTSVYEYEDNEYEIDGPYSVTGPGAGACGSCHKAYKIKSYYNEVLAGAPDTVDLDNSTQVGEYLVAQGFDTTSVTSAINSHFGTMGYYYSSDFMEYIPVVKGIYDTGEILGESCGTCHTP